MNLQVLIVLLTILLSSCASRSINELSTEELRALTSEQVHALTMEEINSLHRWQLFSIPAVADLKQRNGLPFAQKYAVNQKLSTTSPTSVGRLSGPGVEEEVILWFSKIATATELLTGLPSESYEVINLYPEVSSTRMTLIAKVSIFEQISSLRYLVDGVVKSTAFAQPTF